jgi:hypothetical protein
LESRVQANNQSLKIQQSLTSKNTNENIPVDFEPPTTSPKKSIHDLNVVTSYKDESQTDHIDSSVGPLSPSLSIASSVVNSSTKFSKEHIMNIIKHKAMQKLKKIESDVSWRLVTFAYVWTFNRWTFYFVRQAIEGKAQKKSKFIFPFVGCGKYRSVKGENEGLALLQPEKQPHAEVRRFYFKQVFSAKNQSPAKNTRKSRLLTACDEKPPHSAAKQIAIKLKTAYFHSKGILANLVIIRVIPCHHRPHKTNQHHPIRAPVNDRSSMHRN